MIYGYKCNNCGNKFEVLVNTYDNIEQKCPKCNSQKTIKLMGSPSIIFVGDGWPGQDIKKGR